MALVVVVVEGKVIVYSVLFVLGYKDVSWKSSTFWNLRFSLWFNNT